MSVEVSFLSERLVTCLTLIWLLASMDQHVSFETWLMSERLVTYLAFVWLLPTMKQHVSLEGSLPSESLVAFNACEIFKSCHRSIIATLITKIDGLFVIGISFE